MEEALYTAEATAKGDGRDGEVLSSDGVLDEQLAVPKEMGGQGGAHTNPEQLFAAAYAGCFHGALRKVAGDAGVDVTASTVTARVSIGTGELGQFTLSVGLETELTGFEQGQADQLVAQAHQVCPYSNATQGNIVVKVTATT